MVEVNKLIEPEDHIDWNVDLEVQLFYAMKGHKPVGVNRHFQMACIFEKLNNSINKHITAKQIWEHLESMYDMLALHESEILPFPNEESEFYLPELEFEELFKKEEKEKITKESISMPTEEIPVKETKETKENTSTGSTKTKERINNIANADTPDNSPKRKRGPRTAHSQNSSPSSPASNPSSAKRRRVN